MNKELLNRLTMVIVSLWEYAKDDKYQEMYPGAKAKAERIIERYTEEEVEAFINIFESIR